MSEIAVGRKLLTFINVFTVDPRNHEVLLTLLIDATERVICKLPGFISASFHRSEDRTRIVNYAQWESREAFDAMFRHPEAVKHMAAMRGLATSDRNFYDVVSVREVAPADRSCRA